MQEEDKKCNLEARSKEIILNKETDLNTLKYSIKDEVQNSESFKTEAALKREKFEREFKESLNRKKKMMSAPYTNNVFLEKLEQTQKHQERKKFTDFRIQKYENIIDNFKKPKEIRTSKIAYKKEAQQTSKLSMELENTNKQMEIDDNNL